VTIGDEALALSILELKSDEYIEEKLRRQNNEYKKGTRGRRRKNINNEVRKDDGLSHKVSAYLKHRETVQTLRKADPEDKLGWNDYIRTKVRDDRNQQGNKRKGLILKNGYSSMEIPMDDLTEV
jgi:hypothetical protein